MDMTRMVGSGFLLMAFLGVCFALLLTTPVRADDVAQLRNEIQQTNRRLDSVESKTRDDTDGAAILILFGVFCAVWAQNTNRNAWLWFFLGFFLSVISVLFVLYKNSPRRRARSMQFQ